MGTSVTEVEPCGRLRFPLVSKPRHITAFVASAARIQVDDAKATKAVMAKRQSWQDEAWQHYDEVPEVKFGINYLANAMSKVRFYAATLDVDGNPVPINHEVSPLAGTPIATAAEAEMARLRAPIGGQAEFNRMATMSLEVAGEFYIYGREAIAEEGIKGQPGYVPAEPELWDVKSISEVELTDRKDEQGRPIIKIKTGPDDSGTDLDRERETLIRVWHRHPRWSIAADCHLRGCLSDCEALVLLSNQLKAEAKSRQAAGILLMPTELSFTEDETGAEADDTQGSADRDAQQDPFLRALLQALTEPIEDPSAASSVMPLVIEGAAEYLKEIRHLTLARASDSTLDDRIAKRIDRLARGLNVPVEVVMGHMSTTFSNADQIDADVFDDHHEPRCIELSESYAAGFLRPNLATEYDVELVEQVMVWFDASDLVASASVEDAADELLANGAISMQAFRRLKGAEEDDAPDDIERIRNLAERKGIFTADLTALLLEKAGVLSAEDRGSLAPASGGDPAPVDAVTASASRTGLELGRKLMEIDRDLRARLLGAAEAAMARALERAGNRLKSRRGTTTHESLRTVPAYRAAAHLGPRLIAQLGLTDDDLLANAWDELEVQFKLWTIEAADSALDLTQRVLPSFTDKDRDAKRLRLLRDTDDAWQWMAAAMTSLASKALYAPERGAVTAAAGESTPTARVPVGIVREAVASAGGAKGMGGQPGITKPSNKLPVGGVASGDTMVETLRDEGATIEGFRWVYGPARRKEFEPHLNLDGMFFANFDDDVLSNTSGWPETAFYYPGDHDGCACDFELAVETGASASRAPTLDLGDALRSDLLSVTGADDREYERLLEHRHQDERAAAALLMGGDLAHAVSQYAGSGYYVTNQAIRLDRLADYPEAVRAITALDEAFASKGAAAFTSPTKVYRGVNAKLAPQLFDQMNVGGQFVDDAYMSTSLSRGEAERFALKSEVGAEALDRATRALPFKGGAVIEVEVPAGTRFLHASSSEKELLFGRGTQLEVVDVDVENRVIRARIIGSQQ